MFDYMARYIHIKHVKCYIISLRHALMTFRELVYHEVINRLESLALAGEVSPFFFFFFAWHDPRPLTAAVELGMKLAHTISRGGTYKNH